MNLNHMNLSSANASELLKLLQAYKAGSISDEHIIGEINALHQKGFEDIGFAKIDHDRAERQGFPEVIYCQGKTPEQAADIFAHLYRRSTKNIIASRASLDHFEAVRRLTPQALYDETARMVYARRDGSPVDQERFILVLTAGTSDIPVAREAGLTAELMGNRVEYCFDVGVAGIHRLLAKKDLIESANVIIVAAGMEGALASVVGGLAAKPVIAVPTSVGYGTAFGGLTALLSMLNSCAAGVAVMNIDNGFGAGRLASMINHMR